jgi:hypothetical protein
MDKIVQIEIEYDDGSTAFWTIKEDDERLAKVEEILGTPDQQNL